MLHQVQDLKVRSLTAKEERVVEALEQKQPGAATIIKMNLFRSSSDWAEQIASMTEDEAIASLEFLVNSCLP